MTTFDAGLLPRFARDVAVLWDEAQDNPALLRFLAPFGRPDLSRIARRFRGVTEVADVVSERYPVFATWLSTMLLRIGEGTPLTAKSLSPSGAVLEASLFLAEDLTVGAGSTLVVAGSVDARVVRVREGTLVVAGDVRCKLLDADGCVLVGGRVQADFVMAPATQLSETGGRLLGRALGFQVATGVKCRVFDSPRFGLACPVEAEVITRAVGLTPSPAATERLQTLLSDGLVTSRGLVNLEQLSARIQRGQQVFRQTTA